MLNSLLDTARYVVFPFLTEGFSIHLNWLGQFVKIIVESVGNIGVGVIVFALILKAITIPFDIYQRVMMRKQNLIMKKMQPDLEKLQKQYAGDKQTYSMKMMELQKKNGYSILGACLPTIISLVILIVAITAFQTYAQYANLGMYKEMAKSFNDSVFVYTVRGDEGYAFAVSKQDYRLEGDWEEGTPIVDWDYTEGGERTVTENETETVTYLGNGHRVELESGETVVYTVYRRSGSDELFMKVESEKGDVPIYYTYALADATVSREYRIDVDKFYSGCGAEAKEKIDEAVEGGETLSGACLSYLRSIGSAAAAKEFHEGRSPRFLWVKNVWNPDVSYKHPVDADYKAFTQTFNNKSVSSDYGAWSGSKKVEEVIGRDAYRLLTQDLEAEKSQPNGYFVMIVISIGLMLLSQFITMRSQKESNQYQTVDGQGARTQKIMMVVMTVMFAVFGFFWSAAFTIYNVISSAVSILVTLIANFAIGRIFNKREETEMKERYTRTVPWKQEGAKKGKRKK